MLPGNQSRQLDGSRNFSFPHHNCTGEMKIISFINERPVIRKILEHFNLWADEPKQRPTPVRAGPEHPVRRKQRPPDGQLEQGVNGV